LGGSENQEPENGRKSAPAACGHKKRPDHFEKIKKIRLFECIFIANELETQYNQSSKNHISKLFFDFLLIF